MIVWWLITVLLIPQAQAVCVKNRILLWDPVKCEAGRTYFAKLNSVSGLEYVSQPYLYPWLAEVKVSQPSGVRSCTGALINDKYVLTAQECVLPPTTPYQVTVHLGFFNGYDKDVSEIFQPRILDRKAMRLIYYPNYDPKSPATVANNLALIKLENPVQYSKTIYPIQLPTPGDQFKDYTDTYAQNVEWSYFPSFGAQNDKKLKEIGVRILSTGQCNSNYNQIDLVGTLCTVDSGSGIRPCGEEHGGLLTAPVIRKSYNVTALVGIAAWEPPKAASGGVPSPRVYVRVDNKLRWIKENTVDGLYCKY